MGLCARGEPAAVRQDPLRPRRRLGARGTHTERQGAQVVCAVPCGRCDEDPLILELLLEVQEYFDYFVRRGGRRVRVAFSRVETS